MYIWTGKLCFACVLVFALHTFFAYGFFGNQDYEGDFDERDFGVQGKARSGKARFGDRHSTSVHQRRRKINSVNNVVITRCEKTSCVREKRNTNTTRQGVKIILGEQTNNVPDGITSLASALKLLDNKKPTNYTVSTNKFNRTKRKSQEVVNSTKSLEIPVGSKFYPAVKNLSSFGKSLKQLFSLSNVTRIKIKSKLPMSTLHASNDTRTLRMDNKSQTLIKNFTQNQSAKPSIITATIEGNENRVARRMGTNKVKGVTQLASKRQGWLPLKHRVGVPISYGDGPAPLMLPQPNVQSYEPGSIPLMAHPIKNSAPGPLMLNQGIVGHENDGALFEPFGTALNDYLLPQARLPVSIPLNPDMGQAPVHTSLPPKVHFPRPVSPLDPSFIDGLHGGMHSSPVVQQIPVPIPVEGPPKHVPIPVPFPVHVPPQVKNVPYPVPVLVRQPPEVQKIYYPITFHEPPQIKGIPIPVIFHPPPEVKNIPVPVRVPSPPRRVPVPVPSPPRVFVHKVSVPVLSPVQFQHTVSTTVSDLPPENLCVTNPCANGGSCSSFLDSYRCHCSKGYKGRHCEEVSHCHPSPCKNFGSCTELEGDYECSCSRGFKGKSCEIINPCYPQPCKNGAQCWAVDDTYSCSCRDGWMGNNCEVESKCLPINPCQNGGTCSEQSDVYQCSCSPGWMGLSCEIPAAENQARNAVFQAVQCSGCHGNAICLQGRCACRAGFQGDGFYCYVK